MGHLLVSRQSPCGLLYPIAIIRTAPEIKSIGAASLKRMSYPRSSSWHNSLLILLTSAVLLCSFATVGLGAEKVRAAYTSPGPTQGVLWVADVGGLFSKNGLAVEVIYTRSAIEALVAGKSIPAIESLSAPIPRLTLCAHHFTRNVSPSHLGIRHFRFRD